MSSLLWFSLSEHFQLFHFAVFHLFCTWYCRILLFFLYRSDQSCICTQKYGKFNLAEIFPRKESFHWNDFCLICFMQDWSDLYSKMKTSLTQNYMRDSVNSANDISNQWNILFIDVSYHFQTLYYQSILSMCSYCMRVFTNQFKDVRWHK